MQIDRLIQDATQSPPGTTRRQQHVKLAELLTERHAEDSISVKGVEKWAERGTIPGKWLMRIAALPKKPLNLALYA